MHPFLSNRAHLLLYLLGWILLGILLATLAHSDSASWAQSAIFGAIGALLGAALFLAGYFPCRAMPLATTQITPLLSALALTTLVLGGTWALTFFALLRTFKVFPLKHLPWGLALNLSVLGCVLALLMLMLYYLMLAMERSRESERTEQELRVLAREAELKALRAQLNPHFLFNSLNSISALTAIDPGRARDMCVLLADFFRKSLKLGELGLVQVSEEVDLLRAYLSIEQIRFGKRLAVTWDLAPEALDTMIPALLLQPLVENAIKHGIAQLPEGGTIRIAAAVTPSLVTLTVENPLDPYSDAPQGLGMGLRQVRQRLMGRFGETIRFEAGAIDDVHRVRMIFPREMA